MKPLSLAVIGWLLVACASVCAQAPATLASYLYREDGRVVTEFAAFTLVLRDDGSWSSLVIRGGTVSQGPIRPLLDPQSGTWTYRKTGEATGVLTLSSTGAPTRLPILGPRQLTFTTSEAGDIEQALGSSDTSVLRGTFGSTPLSTRLPLVNASTRGLASSNRPLIVGFVVQGRSRDVLLRAVGPGLGAFGVTGAARGTRFDLRRDATHLMTVSITLGAAAFAPVTTFVGAFPLAANSRDAATVLTLSPGAYTLEITPQDDETAEVLGEVYVVP